MLIFYRLVSLEERGQKHSFLAFWSAAAKPASLLRRESNFEASPSRFASARL